MRVLHISDYDVLREIRSGILRQRFEVVESDSAHAEDALAEADFDAVVCCGSVDIRTVLNLKHSVKREQRGVAVVWLAEGPETGSWGVLTASPLRLDTLNQSIEAEILSELLASRVVMICGSSVAREHPSSAHSA